MRTRKIKCHRENISDQKNRTRGMRTVTVAKKAVYDLGVILLLGRDTLTEAMYATSSARTTGTGSGIWRR